MAKGTVLVVDDDRDVRQTVATVLRMSGFDVCTAANGKEALDLLLCSTGADVILLDLMMPVMDGVTFRTVQQKTDAISDIPVVLFSAHASLDSEEVASLQPSGTLRKPVKLQDLLTTIDGALR
jgi:CheY-like chemotaxis protein